MELPQVAAPMSQVVLALVQAMLGRETELERTMRSSRPEPLEMLSDLALAVFRPRWLGSTGAAESKVPAVTIWSSARMMELAIMPCFTTGSAMIARSTFTSVAGVDLRTFRMPEQFLRAHGPTWLGSTTELTKTFTLMVFSLCLKQGIISPTQASTCSLELTDVTQTWTLTPVIASMDSSMTFVSMTKLSMPLESSLPGIVSFQSLRPLVSSG